MTVKLTRENLERLAELPNDFFVGKQHVFDEKYAYVIMNGKQVKKELLPVSFDAVDSCLMAQSVRIIAKRALK